MMHLLVGQGWNIKYIQEHVIKLCIFILQQKVTFLPLFPGFGGTVTFSALEATFDRVLTLSIIATNAADSVIGNVTRQVRLGKLVYLSGIVTLQRTPQNNDLIRVGQLGFIFHFLNQLVQSETCVPILVCVLVFRYFMLREVAFIMLLTFLRFQ